MGSKLGLALAGTVLLASCNSGPPVNYTKQYMAEFVEPNAQAFWKSAGAITDESGTTDLTPTTDEGWAKTLAAASALVKAGEELQTPKYAEGKGEGWIKFSRGLVDMGHKAEDAARAKDGNKVFETGAYTYDVCSGCHQAYPAEKEEAEKSI